MTEYYYRRKLRAKNLLPAGAGALLGLAGFYIVQLLIQRTPLAASSRLTPWSGELPASRLRTG